MEKMMTVWGECLDKDRVLTEYPRPQFVRNSYINLNGSWRYAISKSANIPDRFDGDILVPFSPECPLSGVEKTVMPDDYLHYFRTFELPEGFHRGKVFLNFGAVDQICKVFVNNCFVGGHTGGYTPFTVDITDALRNGINRLNVTVQDLSDTSYHSHGKQKMKRGGIWYTPQSGIWQTVWLESTPVCHIDHIAITPDYDGGAVSFSVFHEGGERETAIQVFDGDKLVAEKIGINRIVLPLPEFKSWSPESPFLYDVVIKTDGEELKSYFAMRKFGICQDHDGVWRLELNNRPYFHNGVLDQGYYPDGFLTPPSDEAMANDIRIMKSMGFNMLRKHIKIEPLRWYYHCDRMGMLVWQDMVNGGEAYGLEVSVIPFINIVLDDRKYKNFGRMDKNGRMQYVAELKEMIRHLYNCPSIAMWVPFNEGWGQFDSRKVYDLIKKLDKTRTVDHASGWHDQGAGDFVSRHIYFTRIQVKQYDKPYILSEFGGLGFKERGHMYGKDSFGYKMFQSKQSLFEAYSKLYINSIIPQISKGLSATVYTQLTDVEDELNGFLTYDRKVNKFDVSEVKAINDMIVL